MKIQIQLNFLVWSFEKKSKLKEEIRRKWNKSENGRIKKNINEKREKNSKRIQITIRMNLSNKKKFFLLVFI